ncbi:alpha-ketoglutarate-dependent dioxygenase AlkB family protein [Motiliproteus sediminis]|uniref:alpha-ketoglutarate-dependent dioxygenase AlkB family protein n=1 Tax=Motiliproteus sediminis TaxID=1468178 RepID=UPI001AF01D65|nr:alpha-ketoglutarate-dependent dioxygenase AlkB [Motiliproteus sediminis]
MDTRQLTRLPLEDGELWWDPQFIPADETSGLQKALEQQIHWRQDNIQMFGRSVAIPRLQAWIGDPGCRYRYSGVTLEPQPWDSASTALRQRIERAIDVHFNGVLANLYRDGSDSVGWHADNEPELGPEPLIASLTLGAERRFCLRHRTDNNRSMELRLPDGALLIMAGPLQHHWLHAVPKSRHALAPRINLSFRRICLRR